MEYGVGCIGSPIGGSGTFNPPASPGKSGIGVSGFPSAGQVSAVIIQVCVLFAILMSSHLCNCHVQ